jgi:hypothetical protein
MPLATTSDILTTSESDGAGAVAWGLLIVDHTVRHRENAMMSLQRIAAAALVTLGAWSLVAPAQEMTTTGADVQAGMGGTDTTIETGEYQGNPWVSGGFGEGGRDELLRRFGDEHNLKLEFALEKGNYVADVDVRIEGVGGETVMDARSKGPWFMTRLPPGNYTVTASGLGQSFERQVSVPESGLNTVVFSTWEDAAAVPQ